MSQLCGLLNIYGFAGLQRCRVVLFYGSWGPLPSLLYHVASTSARGGPPAASVDSAEAMAGRGHTPWPPETTQLNDAFRE